MSKEQDTIKELEMTIEGLMEMFCREKVELEDANVELKEQLNRAETELERKELEIKRLQAVLRNFDTPTSDEWVVTYSNGDSRRFSTDVPLDLIVEYAEDASKFCGQITKIERR